MDRSAEELVQALHEVAVFAAREQRRACGQPGKKRKQSPAQLQRRQVLDWFLSLPLRDCASLCCVTDVAFVKTLLAMGATAQTAVERRRWVGTSVSKNVAEPEFQLLPPPALKQPSSRPTRHHASAAASALASASTLPAMPREFVLRPLKRTADGDAFGAMHAAGHADACREFMALLRLLNADKCCDTVTVALTALKDGVTRRRLFALMEAISEKELFLAEPTIQTLQQRPWSETQWFKARTYFTLAAFVVNQLELNVWAHWQQSQTNDGRPSIPAMGMAPKLLLADELVAAGAARQISVLKSISKVAKDMLSEVKDPQAYRDRLQDLLDVLDALKSHGLQHGGSMTSSSVDRLFSCSFHATLACPTSTSLMLLVMEKLQEECSILMGERLLSDAPANREETEACQAQQTTAQRRRANRKKLLKQRKQASGAKAAQQELMKSVLEELKMKVRKKKDAARKQMRELLQDIIGDAMQQVFAVVTAPPVDTGASTARKKKKKKKSNANKKRETKAASSPTAAVESTSNEKSSPEKEAATNPLTRAARALVPDLQHLSPPPPAHLEGSPLLTTPPLAPTSRFGSTPTTSFSYGPSSPFFLSFSASDIPKRDRGDEDLTNIATAETPESICEWYLPSLFSSQSSVHTTSTVSSLDWDFNHWQNRNDALSGIPEAHVTDKRTRRSEGIAQTKRYSLETFSNMLDMSKEGKPRAVQVDEAEPAAEEGGSDDAAPTSDFLYRDGGFFDRQRALKRRRRPFPFNDIGDDGTSSGENDGWEECSSCCGCACHRRHPKCKCGTRSDSEQEDSSSAEETQPTEQPTVPIADATATRVSELENELREKAKAIEEFSAKMIHEVSVLQQTVNALADKLQSVETNVRELKSQQLAQQSEAHLSPITAATHPPPPPHPEPVFELQAVVGTQQDVQPDGTMPLHARCHMGSANSVLGPFVSVPMSVLPPRTKLHWDMCEFVSQIQAASNNLVSAQMATLRLCTATVQSLWPRAQIRPYGSFVTRLSLPSSDLDLVICLPKVRRDAPADAAGVLEGRNAIKETWQQNLARKLKQEPWVVPDSVKTIPHAAIPIITLLTTPPYNVRLDISFEGPGHNGLATNDVVLSLMHEFPPLAPIMLVLKSFAIERGFAVAYSGGLSSYSLLLMVARYLQEHTDTASQGFDDSAHNPQPCADFGLMLMGFLDFYGTRFDPRTTGISVASRCFLNRENGFFHMSRDAHPYPQHQEHGDDRSVVHHDDWQLHQSAHVPNSNILSSPGSRRYGNRTSLHDWPQKPHVFDQAHDPHKFDPIFIEDPLRISNNVGRNCFRIMQIRRAFAAAHATLMAASISPALFRDNRTTLIAGVALHPDNTLRAILGANAPVKSRDTASSSALPSVPTGMEPHHVPVAGSGNPMYGMPGVGNTSPFRYDRRSYPVANHHPAGTYESTAETVYMQTNAPSPPYRTAASTGTSPSIHAVHRPTTPYVVRRHSECGNDKMSTRSETNPTERRKERLISPRLVPHVRRERSSSPDKLEDNMTRKCPSRSLSFADVVVGGSSRHRREPTSPLALMRSARFWRDDTAIEDYSLNERLETRDDSELK